MDTSSPLQRVYGPQSRRSEAPGTRQAGPETEEFDVEHFIDSARFSRFQGTIMALCFLINAADGFDTVAVGYVGPALAAPWGVSKLALGPLFSAALAGLAIGALLAGPLGDRVGRKRVLIGAVLFFGAWSLASAAATSVTQLTVLRFLTGLGLGAAMPNAVTLLSEYAPAKRRSLLVNIMFCGFTLGAAGGGFAAAWLIPAYGWASIFIVGGVIPIALAIALIWLPESIRFMVVHNWPAPQILKVLKRIDPRIDFSATVFARPGNEAVTVKRPLAILFAPRYRTGSALLWLTYFMGLVVYYLLTSWMPTLMREAGLSLKQAAGLTALLSLGAGVGPVLCGWLMDRANPYAVVATSFAAAAGFVWATGQHLGSTDATAWLVFTTGVFLAGAITSMPALAANWYPTQARASGVAWMLGIGRFGGIVGALAGGPLLAAGYSLGHILGLLAVPALVAAGALVIKASLDASRRAEPVAAPA